MDTRIEVPTDRFFTLSLDMLCVASFEGYFVELNPAWERTLGWRVEELTAKPFLDFVHPDDKASTLSEAMKLQAGADVISFENRYRCRDGTYRWLLWSATAAPEERLYYSVARDITARKRVEQELSRGREEADRANSAKSEFLSRMSHELRTPLTSILGFSELLEMGTLDPGQQTEAVAQIRKAGKHLLALINEVLDIARVESGRLPISIEPVALAEVVADVEDLIGPLAQARGVALHREGDALSTHVLADRQRLKQVLLNLLSNAVKYGGSGGAVTISARQGERRVRIAVADTGPGIAPEHRGLLFVPFERLGAEFHGEEGTGIGLALSKRLVEAMDGEIGVETERGIGSTFWLELDAADAPIEQLERTQRGALPAGSSAAGTRVSTVVYIEDNLANVRLIEYVLAKRPDVRLLSATEGRAGLELARRHRPDLVLLDLNLPDISGQRVLHRLKEDPETADIPVVVLSADAMPGRIAQLREAGALGYLTKPLDVREFVRTLDEVVEGGRR